MDCLKELRQDEIWVGNHDVREGLTIPAYLSAMKTARLGDQAYDITGHPLNKGQMRPLIIHKSEHALYDSIMMARMKED